MGIMLQVDGRDVEVAAGASVLDAINTSGVYVPQLCKDPDMKAIGACRTCLVQIDGVRGFPASCSVQAQAGMRVRTDTPEVRDIRRGVLELTLAMLPENGARDRGDLALAAERHGIEESRWAARPRAGADGSGPAFDIAMADCILCARCAQACQDGHQFIGAIDVLGTGAGTRIGAFMDRTLAESVCTTCGQCLSVCPTGAIRPKAPLARAVRTVATTCPYCGVGCGIRAQVDENGRIVQVLDDPDNLSSLGMLCVKGRFGYTYVHHQDRLRTPLIREKGRLREASWDEALDYVADRLARYRGDAFAAFTSAKATNEDNYIEQKLARVVMQTNNVDHCARLCHAPSVVAMMASLGSGATSNSYVDYEDAGCLVAVGSDTSVNHPVIAARLRRAVTERGARLIVINPKRVDLCDLADIWLRPRPGTDVALLNGIARVILDEGLADVDFVAKRTEGFEEWRKSVDGYDLARTSALTGVPEGDIAAAARLYARPPFSGSCILWGMGITQHVQGTSNAHGLLNLAFVAGQIGKPGSGVSPLRGQNNVQGAGDAGCLPNTFPGYVAINPTSAARFQAAWGGHPLSDRPGLTVTETAEAILSGRVKALYIMGENPMLSEPNLHHFEEALRHLDLLVVQDIFPHETAQLAHVVLPACTFAEKEGTFTNSERRVQRVRRIIEPVGESRPDWEILCDVARRVSRRLALGVEQEFTYGGPSDVWDEMASLVPVLSGISYRRLEREGGLQWPCPTADHPGTRYLHAQEFPIGPRGKLVAIEQEAPADELPDHRFPIILNTGRVLYHWHGGTLTRRAETLLTLSPELEVALNPLDGERYGVADGEWIRVRSRRGDLEGRAVYTERMRPGEIFVPFVKLQEHAANFLTNDALDPRAKIPEYKICAVRVEKVGSPGRRRRPREHAATR